MDRNKLPDPSGEPRPVDSGHALIDVLKTITAFVVGSVSCLFLVATFLTPTMGATRSARLKWEERKRQAEEAAAKAEQALAPAETQRE